MEEIKTFDSRSCKEIYIILSKLGLFHKLPQELQEYIFKNQNLSYKYDFNVDLPLIYQIDNEETKACISYIYLKYINDNTNEKNILLNKYEQNEKVYQQELKEKYNPDNIFNKNIQENSDTTNKISIVKYKESIFKKIFDKIKWIFNIK